MPLFQNATFFTTVNHLRDLPPTSAEIAFVGRSNAGKSSAINALANRTRLAYVSKTPGRTQHINFFRLASHFDYFLVDLPGYGYAEVPESVRAHWVELLGRYLQTRESLIGLLLIMDARHPLKELDMRMLDFFRMRGQPVHILLSKSDKMNRQEQNKTLATVRQALADYPQVSIQLFSSSKKQGLEQVETVVAGWFAGLEARQADELTNGEDDDRTPDPDSAS